MAGDHPDKHPTYLFTSVTSIVKASPGLGTRRAVGTAVIRLSVKLAARASEVKSLAAALRSVMAQALGARGCAGCELSADLQHPDVLHYSEQWFTDIDLCRRICADEFHYLIGVIEAAAEPPHLEIHFVSEIQGLDYVMEVRARRRSCQ